MKDIVLYDGWCPFCKSTINKIKKISNKNMSFESFRETDTYEKYGISEEDLKDRLHVVEKKGRIKSGASAFLIICKNCLLLWPFIPILKLSIRIGIGEKVYDLIAKNRNIIPNSQCDTNCKVDYNVKKN